MNGMPRTTWPSKGLFASLKNATTSSAGRYPSRARLAYAAGDVWPWLTTTLSRAAPSRSAHAKTTMYISRDDNDPPG